MEFAVMRHPTAKIVLLALCFLPGCRGSSAPETPVAAATLAEGEQVTLVQQAGPLAVIEYRDGKQGYVPLGLLKHRNTAVKSNGETFTHTVVRESPVYGEMPSEELAPPEPRAPAGIDGEQKTLNALFIGEKTGQELIAPGNVHYFLVDEATGERCWRSFECTYPGCPGEKTKGRKHHVFILIAEKPGEEEPTIQCDACLTLRDLDTETLDERTKWGSYARVYELPETIRRRTELDDERRRYVEMKRRGVRGQ
ncbi:MAG: hypothetical protein WBF93_06445 [Pirellulales bacterium]